MEKENGKKVSSFMSNNKNNSIKNFVIIKKISNEKKTESTEVSQQNNKKQLNSNFIFHLVLNKNMNLINFLEE